MSAVLRLVSGVTVAHGVGESPAIVTDVVAAAPGDERAAATEGTTRDPALYRRGLASARHALRDGVAHRHARQSDGDR